MHPTYRPEIDGLRAIAVMGVLVYHYGLAGLSAGFAGVDVFFVISGFLIGGIVLEERAAGTFRFRTFYDRRARRILPALFAMILLVAVLAAFILSPNQYRYFGGGAFAGLLFVPNVWFYNIVNYFNPNAELDPLLHTWSLGVEEQFYFGLPILLMFLHRFWRGRIALVLCVLAVASFALMLASVVEKPSAVFYLVQYRAWELLAGVLAALLVRHRAPPLASMAPLFATAGLAAILIGLAAIPPGEGWPNGRTVLPVVGTTLVLLYGYVASPARWLLCLGPVVLVGQISYSLYLWHQPLLSLSILSRTDQTLSLEFRAGLGLACLVVAWLSWRYLERPFRNGGRLSGRASRPILVTAGLLIAVFAIGGHLTEGYPSRLPPDARRAIAFEDSLPPGYTRCANGEVEGDPPHPALVCEHGAAVPANVALWGDSHAAMFAQPLGSELMPNGQALREYTHGGCAPVLGIMNVLQLKNAPIPDALSCDRYNRAVLEEILGDPSIRVVVLLAYWNNYVERRDFDTGSGHPKPDRLYSVPIKTGTRIAEADRIAFLGDGLRQTVATLTDAGREVILVYPFPEPPSDLPQTYARSLWRGEADAAMRSYPRSFFDDYSAKARELLDAAGSQPGVFRFDASPAFCPAERCLLVDDKGDLLFRDNNHPSLVGVARVLPALSAEILDALSQRESAAPLR